MTLNVRLTIKSGSLWYRVLLLVVVLASALNYFLATDVGAGACQCHCNDFNWYWADQICCDVGPCYSICDQICEQDLCGAGTTSRIGVGCAMQYQSGPGNCVATDISGTCCRTDNGNCILMSQYSCETCYAFLWEGAASCGLSSCSGACCDADGTCNIEGKAQCETHGTYEGLQAPCDPNPCPQPASAVPQGAILLLE